MGSIASGFGGAGQRLLAPLLLLLATSCSSPPVDKAGSVESHQTAEVWSLGGWNGRGGVDWVLPRDADIGADGVTVIADSRLPSLVLIDSDGSVRWTIGREGSGPGDFQRPAFVGFRGDSSPTGHAPQPQRRAPSR